MTRPLLEESTEKEVGKLIYRDDMLERRVLPDNVIDYAYIGWEGFAPSFNVPSATLTAFSANGPATFGATTDSNVFGVDLTNFVINWATPGLSFEFYGVVVLKAHIQWLGTYSGQRSLTAGYTYAPPTQYDQFATNELDLATVNNQQEVTALARIGTGEDETGTLAGYIYHTMGAGKDVAGMYLEIALLSSAVA